MAPPSATRGTLSHFICSRWRDLNKRCVNGTCPRPNDPALASYFRTGTFLAMSRAEFSDWCEEWWPRIRAIYDAGDTPSIDRINTRLPYRLGNIRVIPLGLNSQLASRPQRKLSPQDVRDARVLLKSGTRQVDVARRFGVSQVTISNLARKETYAHEC